MFLFLLLFYACFYCLFFKCVFIAFISVQHFAQLCCFLGALKIKWIGLEIKNRQITYIDIALGCPLSFSEVFPPLLNELVPFIQMFSVPRHFC